MKSPSVFLIDIKIFYKLLSLTKTLGLEILDNKMTSYFSWKICTETHFLCLFFLNGKIPAIYHIMIERECAAVIYFIEN